MFSSSCLLNRHPPVAIESGERLDLSSYLGDDFGMLVFRMSIMASAPLKKGSWRKPTVGSSKTQNSLNLYGAMAKREFTLVPLPSTVSEVKHSPGWTVTESPWEQLGSDQRSLRNCSVT